MIKYQKQTLVLLLLALMQSCTSQREQSVQLYSDVDTVSFTRGETVYPFAYINPSEKGWKVVIEVSGDDLNDLSSRVPARKLSTTKPRVLERIRDWKFIYNGGDLATVTSTLLVYKDGTLVDQQGIVLDKEKVGLQSIKYGWIDPASRDDLYQTISLMDEKEF